MSHDIVYNHVPVGSTKRKAQEALETAIFAPQAQLFETGKDRRVKTKALFKQVVKFEQIDPLWSILGENKGGPYCRKSEIT